MKGKQVIIGIAVVAVVAVAYFAFDNSASDEYAVGTIGAADTVIAGVEQADRYRSEQIDAEDVQLGDTELQHFLQSEIVQELISNPSFAKAIQDEAVQHAMEEGWTGAMFEDEEARQALAEIPVDGSGSYDIPIEDAMRELPSEDAMRELPSEDAMRELPVEDASRDVPVDDYSSFEEPFEDEFVRVALTDDEVRAAMLDEYVRRVVGEDWFRGALDDREVRSWLAGAAEKSKEMNAFETDREAGEEFKTDESGREEFKTDGSEGERFKADQEYGEDFKAVSEDMGDFKAASEEAQQFKAALESNPALKKAVFEHAEVFSRAAIEPEFQKALQRTVGEFAKMEELFGKAVIGNRTLAFALAEDPESFMKAAQLARIPELRKMDEGMRRAILTNKSVQEAVLARTVDFEKANQGY